jgi:hypothetical protein
MLGVLPVIWDQEFLKKQRIDLFLSEFIIFPVVSWFYPLSCKQEFLCIFEKIKP